MLKREVSELEKNAGRLFERFKALTDRLGFSRLGVLTQIVVIIAVLCLALVVEGVLGLRIIGSMQKNTNTVSYDIVGKYSNLIEVRKRIQEARNSYLGNLNHGQGVPLSSLLESLRNDIDSLGLGEQKKTILKELSSAKVICEQPLSMENYKLFNQHLNGVELSLNEWEAQAFKLSLQKLTTAREYSVWASGITLFMLLIGGLVALSLGLMVVASIAEPLRTMASVAKSLATGDLTRSVPVSGCAETRAVAESLNQAIDGLRELVRQIDGRAEILFRASEELRTASSETGEGAGQVARAMEELAKAATEQSGHVVKTVETVRHLSELVRKVTEDTEGLAEAAEKVTHSAQLGRRATEEISAGMERIVASARDFAGLITELGKASTQITEVTAAIAGIAEQTTLLALNAEIEAARAGEGGKGFEVIATETVKLSDRSKKAALLIEEIATQMVGRMEQAIAATKEALAQVEAGQGLTAEARVIFQDIFAELERNRHQIDGVASFARATAAANEEVMGAMTTIAAISEESMASAQSVSAVAEEQSAATEQVVSLARELYRIAEELKESVSAFRLGG